jgi:citrate lyase subunit beta/citryl-CoA lyase
MTLFRTWMFVPGNQYRRIDKVKDLKADIIIYDLEDAVPPSEKEKARQLVLQTIEGDFHRTNYVRVNDINTAYFEEDVTSVVTSGLNGIVIPKANRADDIQMIDRLLDSLEKQKRIEKGSIHIVPLIETALGVKNAFEIAKSSERIKQMAFGSIDYTLDINAQLTKEGTEILFARSQLIIASRVAEIEPPIDGVYLNIKDLEGLETETRFVRELGFQGKLVVHPDQIQVVNEVFSPTQKEVTEAREIVDAFGKAIKQGLAALQLNGKMVDFPVAERAKRVVNQAEKLGL